MQPKNSVVYVFLKAYTYLKSEMQISNILLKVLCQMHFGSFQEKYSHIHYVVTKLYTMKHTNKHIIIHIKLQLI